MNLRDRMPDACFFACPDNKFRQMQEAMDIAQADATKAQEAGVSVHGCGILQEHVQALDQAAKQLIEKMPENADGPWYTDYAAEGITGGPQHQVPHCCRFTGVVVLGKGKTVKINRPQ